MDKLHDILLKDEVAKVIVFDETQRSVERLSNELVARGFSADAIHGGKTQGQRQRALDSFKTAGPKHLGGYRRRRPRYRRRRHHPRHQLFQPQSYQDYVHRIGRAGRAGRVGHALTFVNQ